VKGAITAIAGGLLNTVIAALTAAKIDPKVRLNYAEKVQIASKMMKSADDDPSFIVLTETKFR
jgi:hypothetical protein